MHVAEALVYVIVAAFAVAIAVTDSRGLPAPSGRRSWWPRWPPRPSCARNCGSRSHTRSHRTPSSCWHPSCWSTARPAAAARPAALPDLCAGQISDVTVRYVAVPAIVVVCLYRVLADGSVELGRRQRAGGRPVGAAGAGDPRDHEAAPGAYLMVAPKTRIAPFSAWQTNASIAWPRCARCTAYNPPRTRPGWHDGDLRLRRAWRRRHGICGCCGVGAPPAGPSRRW